MAKKLGWGKVAKLTGLSEYKARKLVLLANVPTARPLDEPDEPASPTDGEAGLQMPPDGFSAPPPPDEWGDGLPSDLIGHLTETQPGLYESVSGAYQFNRYTDHYVTWLRCKDGLKTCAGPEHRAILAAYSNWDGKAATLNEISATFGWPRDELVEYLRVHRMTHDREPVTPEELLTESPARALKTIEARRRGALRRMAEAQKWRDEKKDAARWRAWEQEGWEVVREHFDRLARRPRQPAQVLVAPAERPYALVTSATDFHFGMYAWAGMTTRPYSRAEAKERLLEHTSVLLAETSLRGAPERIYLGIGSDFFHCDGVAAATTSGTPLDIDGTPQQIMLAGLDLTVEHIDMLKSVAPVTVVCLQGNHDRANATAALWGMAAWFRGDPRVDVIMDARSRVYTEYGENLITWAHGDGVKPKELVRCISAEARQAWGRCRWKYVMAGHLHTESVQEIGGGIKYIQLPSLAGSDRWHAHNGFTSGIPGLAGCLMDRERGHIATLFSPVLADHDERVWEAA